MALNISGTSDNAAQVRLIAETSPLKNLPLIPSDLLLTASSAGSHFQVDAAVVTQIQSAARTNAAPIPAAQSSAVTNAGAGPAATAQAEALVSRLQISA